MSLNPRLRKLNYKGSIATLQRILSPSLRYKFKPPPSLTHLLIIFYQWSDIPIANIAVFVAFLQCLEQTLESLSLTIPKQLTSILSKLPHFPRLENLDIDLKTDRIIPEEGLAFTSFLSTHREYLKTLTLCLNGKLSSGVQIYQGFCNISFPFLHTLVLDHTQDFVKLTQAFPRVPHLQRFVSGGRYHLDKETTMKIRERASPSRPTIALVGDQFWDVQVGLTRRVVSAYWQRDVEGRFLLQRAASKPLHEI